MTEIRIYFEGSPKLRAGFHSFYSELRDKANSMRRSISFVAGNGRDDAIHDFGLAIESHPTAWNILLIDSEECFRDALAKDLCRTNHIGQAHARSVFWMVQIMESWFLADPIALSKYYGIGFNAKHAGKHKDIETISKADVLAKLKRATRTTAKGEYHKTAHAPDLLAKIDPDRVRGASVNCDLLFQAILRALT